MYVGYTTVFVGGLEPGPDTQPWRAPSCQTVGSAKGLLVNETGVSELTQMIDRARNGDPRAERELYEGNVDRIYRLAYRLTGDEELAQDFTQQTFIRAFDRLGTFRGEAKLSTWLCSVATSVVYNGLRKVKRFRQREVDLDHAAPQADRKRQAEPDLKDRLREAINGLPQGYRMVFLMHDVEGFTHEEIGTALGIQSGTSKAQLSRARAKLRGSLAAFAGGSGS